MKPKLYIGIDTGTHTGVGVWDSQKKKLIYVGSMELHRAMAVVLTLWAQRESFNIEVRIEDPRLRTWFGSERMSRAEERKKLQGVGSVKRDASIWEEFLSDFKIPFRMTHPKDNMTKVRADWFKTVTGWQGRTNEHSRDAAMIVFGLRP